MTGHTFSGLVSSLDHNAEQVGELLRKTILKACRSCGMADCGPVVSLEPCFLSLSISIPVGLNCIVKYLLSAKNHEIEAALDL